VANLVEYALTTLAAAKEASGTTGTSQDNLIIRKINQATEMIERACRLPRDHHFVSTEYENELYNGTGIDELVLRMSPVNKEETLTLQERTATTNTDSWSTVDTDLYFVDYGAGVLRSAFTFLSYPQHYRVTYTAGYDEVPSDLAEACVILANYLVDNAASGTSVKRKKEGQREIEYHDTSSDTASIFDTVGISEVIDTYAYEPLNDWR